MPVLPKVPRSLNVDIPGGKINMQDWYKVQFIHMDVLWLCTCAIYIYTLIIQMYIHRCICMRAFLDTSLYIYTYMHTYIHIYISIYVCVFIYLVAYCSTVCLCVHTLVLWKSAAQFTRCSTQLCNSPGWPRRTASNRIVPSGNLTLLWQTAWKSPFSMGKSRQKRPFPIVMLN